MHTKLQTPEPALDDFTMAYILAALWTFDDDAPSGDYETSGRFQELFPLLDGDAILKMADDCARFQKENAALITQAELSESRAGHCFWLSRNGHGSGFFDEYSISECDKFKDVSRSRELRDDRTCQCKFHACQRLQEKAREFGTVDIYTGDDQKIYQSP
jgi:hypothetical protein